jgi:hypothetical protein
MILGFSIYNEEVTETNDAIKQRVDATTLEATMFYPLNRYLDTYFTASTNFYSKGRSVGSNRRDEFSGSGTVHLLRKPIFDVSYTLIRSSFQKETDDPGRIFPYDTYKNNYYHVITFYLYHAFTNWLSLSATDYITYEDRGDYLSNTIGGSVNVAPHENLRLSLEAWRTKGIRHADADSTINEYTAGCAILF